MPVDRRSSTKRGVQGLKDAAHGQSATTTVIHARFPHLGLQLFCLTQDFRKVDFEGTGDSPKRPPTRFRIALFEANQGVLADLRVECKTARPDAAIYSLALDGLTKCLQPVPALIHVSSPTAAAQPEGDSGDRLCTHGSDRTMQAAPLLTRVGLVLTCARRAVLLW
jgi:hypothetical protein